MYKYRVRGKREDKYQIEDLVANKATIVSEEKVKGYAKKGMLTNAVVRGGELIQVKDALEAYIRLRDQIWEVSCLSAFVGGKADKGCSVYCIRVFDGYGEDVTASVYDFTYAELGLVLENGNIIYKTQSLNPLGDIQTVINKKGEKIQKELVPEKARLVDEIVEYRISKAMKEVIKSWEC